MRDWRRVRNDRLIKAKRRANLRDKPYTSQVFSFGIPNRAVRDRGSEEPIILSTGIDEHWDATENARGNRNYLRNKTLTW